MSEISSLPKTGSAVYALAACVALLIMAEFMPVSLLTPIAQTLHAKNGMTGQSVSLSGFFAVGASLTLTILIGRIDRRKILLGLTVCLLLSQFLMAVAQGFIVLLLARALLGVCVGGFWSLATTVIMRLVPAPDIPKALGILYGGQAIAAALGAPAGALLGGLMGWRAVFWLLIPLIVATLVWQWRVLPSLPVRAECHGVALGIVLGRPFFRKGLVAVMLSWGAAFTMFTYLRPFLEWRNHADSVLLTVLFLALGLAGFPGSWAAGRLVRYVRVHRLLFLPTLVMGTSTLALLMSGASPVFTAICLLVWGGMNTAMSVLWMSWLADAVQDYSEEAGSLMVAAIQASILSGSLIGGILLDRFSVTAPFWASVGISAFVALLIGNGKQLIPRQGSASVDEGR